MPGNHVPGTRELPAYVPQRDRPGRQVGLRYVPEVRGFGAFHEAAAVQEAGFGEPDHDVVPGVALAGVVGSERTAAHGEVAPGAAAY